MTKLVIFDCDGVLVDTEPVTDRIIAANLGRHGLPLDPSEVHTLFGGGTIRGVGQEAQRRGAMLPDDWQERMYAELFEELAKGVPVIPGVIDLIDRIEAAGIAIAVASNGPIAKMEISLGPSGLFTRLAGRLYSGHDFAPKPAPDMLHHAMHVAGASAADTVMIDDMPAGWQAGAAAGVRTFAYVADGGPARAAGYPVTPVTDMAQIAVTLDL